jgi:cobalt-zinc-cadmium resistance protein CzcA
LVKTAFAGEEAGVVYEGEKRFGLVVRLDSAYRKDLQNISDLYVDLPNGGKIPLSQVAIFHIRTLLPKLLAIMHVVVLRLVLMFVIVMSKAWCMKYNRFNEKVELPAGYNFVYGGAFENLNAAKVVWQ